METMEVMEVVKTLSKNTKECDFCSVGMCPSTPAMINAIVKGRRVKLNICIPSSATIVVKGESAKVYDRDS